jgi:hypothetical protein
MGRVRGRWVGALAGTAAIAAAILVVAGSASAVTVLAGNLSIEVAGSTSPKLLPKRRMAPISFHGSASIATEDGSHIPPARSTQLLVDKHIAIDTTGLPTCTLAQIQSTDPATAMKVCGDALIGKGTSTAQVKFPEQEAFTAGGPLLAFNGPSSGGYGGKGYGEQLYYVYADVPVPTALIAVAKVSKGTGRYSYKISISIPEIAGGAGSFSGAEFTIDRKWTYRGQKHSFLTAECANGHFDAKVEVAFGDGTDVTGNVLQACRSKG